MELDRYLHPGFDGLATDARRDKAPILDRVGCGSVEQVVPGTGIDLDGLGLTLFINENAQKHSAFFAFTLILATYLLGREALWIGLALSLLALLSRALLHRRHAVLTLANLGAVTDLGEALALVLLAVL